MRGGSDIRKKRYAISLLMLKVLNQDASSLWILVGPFVKYKKDASSPTLSNLFDTFEYIGSLKDEKSFGPDSIR